MRRRVIFLGNDVQIREIKREIKRHPELGYTIGSRSSLRGAVVVGDGKWIGRHQRATAGVVRMAVEKNIPVMDTETFYERLFGMLHPESARRPGWLMEHVMESTSRSLYRRELKRVLDVCVAIGALVVVCPVLALCAFAIRVCDGSPVFCGQYRLGLLGKEFRLLSFRTGETMNGKQQARRHFTFARYVRGEGARTTRTGRLIRLFRVDEFLQLWNVVRGEMSLVGPSPTWPAEMTTMERIVPYYRLRHLVRPGITGWAQVEFRVPRNFDEAFERLRYDLYYVKNLSLALDVSILLKTARRAMVSDTRLARALAPGRLSESKASASDLDIEKLIGP